MKICIKKKGIFGGKETGGNTNEKYNPSQRKIIITHYKESFLFVFFLEQERTIITSNSKQQP